MTFISVSGLGRLRGFFHSCSLEIPVWAADCCSWHQNYLSQRCDSWCGQFTAPLKLEGTSGGLLANPLLQDGWLWNETRVLEDLQKTSLFHCFTLLFLQNLVPISRSILLMLWFMPMASQLPLKSLALPAQCSKMVCLEAQLGWKCCYPNWI